MKTTLTKSYRQHIATPSKNRVRLLFGVTSSCTGVIWPQAPETQQETSGISTLLVSDVRNWLSKDPIGISGGLNQYVFVENSPVNFRDPSGLCKENDGTDPLLPLMLLEGAKRSLTVNTPDGQLTVNSSVKAIETALGTGAPGEGHAFYNRTWVQRWFGIPNPFTGGNNN